MNKILADYCINITDGEHGTVIDDPNGEYYLLSNKNIVSGQIKINSKEDRTINKEWFDKINKRVRLDIEDVLISTVGTIGKVAIVQSPINYTVQRSVGVIKTDKKQLDPYFLAYQLQIPQFQKRLVSLSKGAVQKCLFISDLKTLQISVPPLEEQKVISSVLRNIDLKIQNNKQQIETLESLAKTIYDYWFVQFDFPNEDGKPYKSSGGKMVWNEELKREIPEGWKVGILSNIANITMGQSPSGSTYNKDNTGVIFFQGCAEFGNRYPNEKIYTSAPSRKAKKNDILMSVRAPVGDINISLTDCCIGRGLSSLRHKDNYQSYLYYLLHNMKKYFNILNGNGTTFGSLTKDMLYQFTVIIPNNNYVKRFEYITSEMEKKMEIAELEIRKLTKTKEFILPLLMNGQAHIK